MSLLRKKSGSAEGADARLRTRAKRQASQAVPLAKSAGAAARQGAGQAAARARPHVHRARRWAAPRIERTGKAVQEKVAPQVSAMMTKAARRMDPDSKARRRSWLTRGSALLVTAASAIAVILLRKHAVAPGDGGASEASPEHGTGEQAAAADDTAKVNGRVTAS